MGNEETGESSRKGEHSTNEKPLKKARYVWEVKGKYHLKDNQKHTKQSENKDVSGPHFEWASDNLAMESVYDKDPERLSVHCNGRCSIDAILKSSR